MKKQYEKILIDAGLSKDPFTAELMLMGRPGIYAEPTYEVLQAIFYLKKLVIFDVFGDTEGGAQ